MRLWSVVLAVVVVVAAAGCGSGNDPAANAPAGAKAGSWDGECEAGLFNDCSDEGARHKLEPREVWCVWRGDSVVVHVALKSNFNARLDVSVIPRYVIKDGGQHGTSLGSEVGRTVAAQGRVVFNIDAGHPKGVPDGTEISECKPKLYDVKIAG